MKRKLVSAIVAVVCLLALAFCAPSKSPTVLGESDNGKNITLNKGDSLAVSLPGNITTGYTWEMLPMNPAVLAYAGEPEMTPNSQVLGSGGTIVLRFRATDAGQADLELVYRKSSETTLPEKTFTVHVTVK